MSAQEKVTPRMIEALGVLADAPADGWTPSTFAAKFWPEKLFARGQGPWGAGPDASGRHGGKMLTRLERAGLARFHDHYGYYTATVTARGRALLKEQS